MSDKAFDWDAFNKTLQGSSNICSGVRKDIENAIAAGKGQQPALKEGQIYCADGNLYIIHRNRDLARNVGWSRVGLTGLFAGNEWGASGLSREYLEQDCAAFGFKFVASSLKEYLDNGGSL